MEDCLSTTLSWMPEVDTYFGRHQLKTGAQHAIVYYFFINVYYVVKPMASVAYHHESGHFISFIQCCCLYTAAACAFFAFYLNFNLCFGLRNADISYNAATLLFVLLCLIMILSGFVWELATFIRGFVAPGLCYKDNRTNNPHVWRSRYRILRMQRMDKIVTREENEKEKQRLKLKEEFDKKHANDTIVTVPNPYCDMIYSMMECLANVVGFYLLICFNSYVNE